MSTSATPGDAREARQRISPADAPRAGAANPPLAYLLIRIWMSSQPAADRGLLSWGTESSLIQMIADLVSASGGAPAGKRNNGLIAQFPNVADAGTAAVRLQRAIAGFAAQSKAPPAASVALFCADKAGGELDESSDELETASVLASAAQPAQILLTAAACAELHRNMPYTSRSAAPFRMPNGMHSNLRAYQLTWNEASPISGERPRTGITTPPTLTDPETSAAEPIRTQQSAAFPDAVSQAVLFTTSEPASRSRTVAINLRRLPVYTTIAAVVITIAAAGTWFLMRPPRSTPPVNTPGMQDPPKTVPPTPQPPPPVPKPQPPNPPAPPKPPPAKGLASVDGFSRNDIPWLLEKADRESGDGDYDAAERNYKIVQRLDPGNSRAHSGILRNSARRSEQQ